MDSKLNNSNSYFGYSDLLSDGRVKKKTSTIGFGAHPNEGDELTLNFTSYLEDGRNLDSTFVTKEPLIIQLGKYSVVPGLEIALKKMKMGESSSIFINPEYSFLLQEKLKAKTSSADSTELNFQDELEKVKIQIKEKIANFSIEEIKSPSFDVKESKNYLPVIYEVTLEKIDKVRKSKSAMDYEERIAESAIIKIEGNELFKEKRFKEAIVKYNTGLSYLHQLPNEFSLSNKVIDLRITLNLNIVNCHLSISEYVYALKKLEEIENMNKSQNIQQIKNFPPIKFYYYRCSANMNLGEFEKAGQDFKILKTQLANDPIVKQLENDFVKIKENTINKKKDMIKKGIFGSNLYEDISQGNKICNSKNAIPKFDVNNYDSKLFYLDLLISKNSKDPQKIKFEIFKNTIDKIKPVFEFLDDQIKNKILIKNEVIVNYDEKLKQDIVILSKIENSDDIKKLLDENTNFKKEINLYAACEEYLLILLRHEIFLNDKVCEIFSIAVTSTKISEEIIPDVLVIGRGVYNPYSIEKIINLNKKDKVVVDITDCGYSKMLI